MSPLGEVPRHGARQGGPKADQGDAGLEPALSQNPDSAAHPRSLTCPVECLVWQLSYDPAEARILVLRAYFDASGSQSDPSSRSVMVGGYVASVEQWRDVEADWVAMLGQYGIPDFHAKEIFRRPRKQPYDVLTQDRAESLSRDITSLIAGHGLRGYASLVRFEDYEAANREFELRESLGTGPFGLAGGLVVGKVQRAIGAAGRNLWTAFEQGDAGAADIKYLMERDPLAQTPQFLRRVTVGPQPAYIRAFELADYLVYAGRASRNRLDDARRVIERFKQFERETSPDFGEAKLEHIREICVKSGVPRR